MLVWLMAIYRSPLLARALGVLLAVGALASPARAAECVWRARNRIPILVCTVAGANRAVRATGALTATAVTTAGGSVSSDWSRRIWCGLVAGSNHRSSCRPRFCWRLAAHLAIRWRESPQHLVSYRSGALTA